MTHIIHNMILTQRQLPVMCEICCKFFVFQQNSLLSVHSLCVFHYSIIGELAWRLLLHEGITLSLCNVIVKFVAYCL